MKATYLRQFGLRASHLGWLVIWIVQLGGDPDVLPLWAFGVAEHLLEGIAHLIMVAICVSTVNVPIAYPQGVLYSFLYLVCSVMILSSNLVS